MKYSGFWAARNNPTLPPGIRLYGWVLMIAPFILLAPVWVEGKALFWGVVSLQFVPWRAYAVEILRSGHLPFWNPLNGMGAPLLANYQSALLYPPNWILFLLQALGGTEWAAWGQALLAAAHLAWAGFGMASLAAHLRINPVGRIISGLAFCLSGYLVSRLGFLSINVAVAWLPWVILEVDKMFSRLPDPDSSPSDSKKKARLFCAFWGVRWLVLIIMFQLLAGHAQTVWLTWIMAIAWCGMRSLQFLLHRSSAEQEDRPGEKLVEKGQTVISRWATLAIALGFGLVLSAVQIWPTLEYLLTSQRASQVGYEFAMTYSFWPWRFLTILAPDLFGNPVRGNYWGYGNYWEDAVYIGVLPLILAIFAVFRKRIEVKFLFGVAVFAFLLALGKNTPVYPWLYRTIPTFALFQAPTRFTLLAVFCLSLLAGFGVDGWVRPTDRALYWTRLSTAGAFAVTLGTGFAWYSFPDVTATFLRATALAGLWGFGTGLLALLAPHETIEGADLHRAYKPGDLMWSWGVILFVSSDLLVGGWGLNPGITLDFYRHDSLGNAEVRKVAGDGRIYLPPADEESLKFDRFMRFDSYDPGLDWMGLRKAVLPNINLLEGVSSANNFDPLVSGSYARWMQAMARAEPSVLVTALNLMAVNAVEKMDSTTPDGVSFTQMEAHSRMRWVSCNLSAVDMEQAIKMVFSGSVDPDQQVVIERGSQVIEDEIGCNLPAGEAQVVTLSENPNRILLRVKAFSQGWLVLSDLWYPGWKAKVDGKGISIRRANGIFRAISVDSGEHLVEFVYQPMSIYIGAITSLLGLILMVFVFRKGV